MNNLERVHNAIKNRTLLIEAVTPKKERWGTGFIFDDMQGEEILCLTARHCITTTGEYADKNILPTSSIRIKSLFLKEKFEVLEVLEVKDEAKDSDDFVDLALLKLRYTGDINDLRNLDKIRLMSYLPDDRKTEYMFFGFPKINMKKKDFFKKEEEILNLYNGRYWESSSTEFKVFVGQVDASESGDSRGMVKGISGGGVLILSAGHLFLVGIVTDVRPDATAFRCERITQIHATLIALGKERKFESKEDFYEWENENSVTLKEDEEVREVAKFVKRRLQNLQQEGFGEVASLNLLKDELIAFATNQLFNSLANEIRDTFDQHILAVGFSEKTAAYSGKKVISNIINWFGKYPFGKPAKKFLEEFITFSKTIIGNE